MATHPDPLERRNLLHVEQKRPVDFVAIAETYLGDDRKNEAIDFIERVEDASRKEGLRARVREAAVKAGDYFLLNRVDLLSKVDEADWRKALANAMAQKKTRYAIKLARKLGDTKTLEELDPSLRQPEPATIPAPLDGEAAAAVGGPVAAVPAGEGGKGEQGAGDAGRVV